MVIHSIFVYLVNLINLWHQFQLYHLFFFHLSIDLAVNHSQVEGFLSFFFFFLASFQKFIVFLVTHRYKRVKLFNSNNTTDANVVF